MAMGIPVTIHPDIRPWAVAAEISPLMRTRSRMVEPMVSSIPARLPPTLIWTRIAVTTSSRSSLPLRRAVLASAFSREPPTCSSRTQRPNSSWIGGLASLEITSSVCGSEWPAFIELAIRLSTSTSWLLRRFRRRPARNFTYMPGTRTPSTAPMGTATLTPKRRKQMPATRAVQPTWAMMYSEGLSRRPARASRSGSGTRPRRCSRALTRSATPWKAPSSWLLRPPRSSGGARPRTMKATSIPAPAMAARPRIPSRVTVTSVQLLRRGLWSRLEERLREVLAARPQLVEVDRHGSGGGVVAEGVAVRRDAELAVGEDLLEGDLTVREAQDLGDADDAPGASSHPLGLNQNVDRARHLLLDGRGGQVGAGHQDHGLEPCHRVLRGVGVQRGQGAVVAGVHGLQHVQGLAAAAFADDDAVGTHQQRDADPLPERHGPSSPHLRRPRL